MLADSLAEGVGNINEGVGNIAEGVGKLAEGAGKQKQNTRQKSIPNEADTKSNQQRDTPGNERPNLSHISPAV